MQRQRLGGPFDAEGSRCAHRHNPPSDTQPHFCARAVGEHRRWIDSAWPGSAAERAVKDHLSALEATRADHARPPERVHGPFDGDLAPAVLANTELLDDVSPVLHEAVRYVLEFDVSARLDQKANVVDEGIAALHSRPGPSGARD